MELLEREWASSRTVLERVSRSSSLFQISAVNVTEDRNLCIVGQARKEYVHINNIPRNRNRNGPISRNQIIQVLRLAIAHALLHYHQYTLSDSRMRLGVARSSYIAV